MIENVPYITIERLTAWRDRVAAEQIARGRLHFLGRPVGWYEDVSFFCPSGHVSGNILKTEAGDRCLACRCPVVMGPPGLGEREFRDLLERGIIC